MTKYQGKYSLLDWDSKLFGYSVAKIPETISGADVYEVIEYLRKKRVKLIYIIGNPSDKGRNAVIAKLGGKLVDIKRVYSRNIDMFEGEKSDFPQISPYTDTKVNITLRKLAYQSGIHSRFFIDTKFTHNEYRKLYTKWIEKAVLGINAFEVLVYRDEEGVIGGFITLEKEGTSGKVGLLAVDHTLRRKKIGSKLLMRSFDSFRSHGLKRMSITTQKSNDPACRLYEKHGFHIVSEQYIYHLWL